MDTIKISEDFIKSLGFEIQYTHFRVFNDIDSLRQGKPYPIFVLGKKLRKCIKTNTVPDNTIYNELKKLNIGIPHVKTLCPQKGGYTKCTLTNNKGHVFVGNALCNNKDNFNKKIGREKALQEAFTDFISYYHSTILPKT